MNKETIYFALARMVPKGIMYWLFLQVIAETTTGRYSNTIVPELTCMDALERWSKLHNIK